MELTEEWVQRFNAKWSLDDKSGCWLWRGACLPKGYGTIKIPKTRRQEYAHRLAWRIAYGEIPKGRYVLHRCDTPACVNPKHLFLGDAKANAQDMKAKDRHLRGERNSGASLVEAEVVKIKVLLRAGLFSQEKLGEMFGVHQMTISRIHRGLSWAHVTPFSGEQDASR